MSEKTLNYEDAAEVMRSAGMFAGIQDRQSGADVIAAVCDCMKMTKKDRDRVLDCFMGAPRKRIKFSTARMMVGIKDRRTWYARCDKDPRFASVRIVRDTQTSHFCWEDEVLRLAARLTENAPRDS